MVRFEKIHIADVTYEAASVCDINGDGHLDIVCGEYWFQGPDFTERHKMCDVRPEGEYYDDFSDFPMDVNGDGFPDIVTGAWFDGVLRWRENPGGRLEPWTVHDIAEVGNIERPMFADLDGDGVCEVAPNCPAMPVKVFKLNRDAHGRGTGSFREFQLTDAPQGHGMGFGDVAGNGRMDIVLNGGWLEAPADGLGGVWKMHAEFDLGGSASCPILVHDVNGNGLSDLIVGMGHDYGLAWWEQRRGPGGERSWVKHDIDPDRSQYHDLQLVDIDNDGELELVTGKRYRAHCGNDPGADDPIGIYYFKMRNGAFERMTIDYGPAGQASGVGIYFWVEDLYGSGRKDLIAPGKDGLYVFRNLGEA